MANLKDFATGTVFTAPTPATSGTTLVLNSGEGAYMPATPFYATVHPPAVFPTVGNSEKVKVTNVSGDTLTIQRGISGISAKAIQVGWRVSNTLFKRDVAPVKVTVTTAAATAAKVGTSDVGSYVPEQGDLIEVTFTLGSNVSSPTLNIDGGGAKNILLGNVAASTAFIGTTSALVLRFWYDGSGYQMFGSLKNDNTTYTEITDAESIATTSSTARLVSGRRLEYFKNNSLIIDEDNMASDNATKMPSQQSVKAYVDAAVTAAIETSKQQAYPVGSLYFNADNATNPATLLGFGTWVAYAEGRVPVGKAPSGTFDTAGGTNGVESYDMTHAMLVGHWHSIFLNTTHSDGASSSKEALNTSLVGSGRFRYRAGTGQGTNGSIFEGQNEVSGTQRTAPTTPLSTLQPSVTVYIWRRTA